MGDPKRREGERRELRSPKMKRPQPGAAMKLLAYLASQVIL